MKNNNRFINKITKIFIITLVTLGLAASPGAAQSQTVLFVSPEHTEVPLGSDLIITVEVRLGLNINAFDLTVIYDSEILNLEDWEHGDYLDNLANIKVEQEPGFLRVAATQLATPAVSGDGVLIELTFNTLAAGQSAIELVNVTFSDSEGNKTEPVLEEGIVDVVIAATYTPTVKPTNTPTPKPTVTPYPTDGDSGYPVKTDPTQTATTTGGEYPSNGSEDPSREDQSTETAGDYPVMTGYEVDETMAAVDPGAGGSEDNPSTGDPAGEAADDVNSDQALTPGQTVLNMMLWAVLVIAVLVMFGMVIIAIRRRKQKHEDYLL
ncbi:MAG: hypothetical protein H0S82_01180 [Anaerolineaceae bacterium]|nr:hypothetical protein [Anaerolineaceae bacterium]